VVVLVVVVVLGPGCWFDLSDHVGERVRMDIKGSTPVDHGPGLLARVGQRIHVG